MRTFFTVILFIYVLSGFSQTKITGRIIDERNQPIPLANVILVDTYDGSTTDNEGKFEFSTTETGAKLLVVRFIGFKEEERALTLNGTPISVEITLKESINELEAVTISAGAFTASDESRRTVFKAIDIATTAGATADIAGALNTLPGTQKVGESGRLFVRGGDGNETRTFIDGQVVLDAYAPSAPNAASRGRFLPFMFKGTSFSTGGYSAEYGQALSSALVLDSKDESEITRTDFGLLSVGGDVTHTQAWDRGSASAKIQYTNIRPYFNMINQVIDWKEPPVSIEGIGAFRQRVGEHGMLKLYGNFNNSNFSLYNHDIDDYSKTQLYELTNNFRYANASYKDVINKNWSVRGGLSYSYIDNETSLDEAYSSEQERGLHAKTVFDGSLSDFVELKTGVEIIQRNITSSQYNDFNEDIIAGFAEADVYTSNKFITRIGSRLEHNTLMESVSVDPRLSMAYKTGESSQISFAYGQFRQSPKNEWLRIDNSLKSEKAEHFILNYQRIENRRTFRVESYYKKYNDLISYTDLTNISNNGDGYAKGVELFWRDNESLKNVDYWISYSFLDTKRNYLNFPYEAVPFFASKHNFSAVYKHFVPKIKSQLGFTYSYSSGRPYYNPNAVKFNSNKTPHYADLSFNWSYLPKPYLILYFSCTNLLGRDNIFGYEFSNTLNESGGYTGRPIVQPAKRFVFLGIFLTLTKDKTVNQLPTL
jgi:hypothetical protein